MANCNSVGNSVLQCFSGGHKMTVRKASPVSNLAMSCFSKHFFIVRVTEFPPSGKQLSLLAFAFRQQNPALLRFGILCVGSHCETHCFDSWFDAASVQLSAALSSLYVFLLAAHTSNNVVHMMNMYVVTRVFCSFETAPLAGHTLQGFS